MSYSPVDLTSRSFWPHGFDNPSAALQDCLGSLSTITSLHPMISPSAPWSNQSHDSARLIMTIPCPRRLQSLGPYTQRSIGFSLFNRVPQSVSRSGANPLRRSDHRMVDNLATTKSTRAVLPSSRQEDCPSGPSSPCLPTTSHSSQNIASQQSTATLRLVDALGCLCLVPLPPCRCPSSLFEDHC